MDIDLNVTHADNTCNAPTDPQEEWRLIEDPVFVSNRYYVSNLGRVFDTKQNKALSQSTDRDGYKKVTLRRTSAVGRPVSIHRLVADAFLSPPLEGQTSIDHINGDPADNRVENLRRCTQKENINNPISLRNHRRAAKRQGRPSKRRVMCWEDHAKFDSITKAADTYGVSINTVSRSCRSGIIPAPGTETIIGGHLVHHFCYIDENDNPSPMERRTAAPRNQPIRCKETGVCYATISEASANLGITYEAIRVALSRKSSGIKPMTVKLDKPVYHFEKITRDVYLAWLQSQEAVGQT